MLKTVSCIRKNAEKCTQMRQMGKPISNSPFAITISRSTSTPTSQGCPTVMLCTPAQHSTGLTSILNTTPPDDRPRHARHLSVHDKCKLQARACAWACSSSQTHCQCHPPCAKPRPSSLRLSCSCFWECPVVEHGRPTTTTCY